ncbi:hypothetical protein TNCV_2657601 [Trichonephila clavipes]|nr:hypothetical protein TNCV_2657601 [Trichonephila clavipes]
MEVEVFSFGRHHALVVVQTFTSSTQVQSNGTRYCNEFFFHMCVFLEALWVCSFPFNGRQCTMSSHSSCRTALKARRLAARTLPPVTIQGASIGAARRMGSNASTTH